LPSRRSAALERDVVVHATGLEGRGVGLRTASATAFAAPCRRAGEAAAALAIAGIVATAVTTAVEHGEVGVEALQHHFGGILVHPVLVLPLAGLQLAFDVNLRAL